MKFRKKPVEIEAFCFTVDPIPDWFMDRVSDNSIRLHDCYDGGGFVPNKGTADIKTLEGVMTAKAGDYIIKGVKGEIYPCKPDIFEATYEAVE